MKNIIIVDDHPLVREGIKKVIQKTMDFQISGEASDGNELMALLRDELPDIVILDISMPGKSGLELLKDLKSYFPQLPALILSIHSEKRMALRAIKAGAWGYINKSEITEELINALRKITLQKRRYINPEVAQQLATQINDDNHEHLYESLSDREFQTMLLIASGKNVSRIADKLSLSAPTIYTYRRRIKEKTGLKTNVEITRYVMENDLLE